MSRIVDAVKQVLGRSVVDLAGEVDAALGRLASAQHQHAQCKETLANLEQMVAEARADVAKARNALFQEHPDLAPEGWSKPVPENPRTRVLLPDEAVANPGAWDPEVVEVDDPNDERFTAGAPAVAIDPSDEADLPPIEWGEHDG